MEIVFASRHHRVGEYQLALDTEPTQTSNAYGQIRADIVNGNLPANTRLRTRKLAEQYDVGLSPLREALSRLSSEGWVTQSERRGFSVVPVTVDQLWDLHRARCMLNEIGLRESIEHGDHAWEESILLCYVRISRLQRPADMTSSAEFDVWSARHKDFHTSLICACQSQRIINYCEHLFDEIERYRRVGLTQKNSMGRENVADEHREIADAAMARDAALATRLLNAHFTVTVEQVTVALENRQATGAA